MCCICSLVSNKAVTFVGTNFIETALLTISVLLCTFINICVRDGCEGMREKKKEMGKGRRGRNEEEEGRERVREREERKGKGKQDEVK